MAYKVSDEQKIKESVRQALVELLRERKDLLCDLVTDIVQDCALARAIKEGEQTAKVGRENVVRALA